MRFQVSLPLGYSWSSLEHPSERANGLSNARINRWARFPEIRDLTQMIRRRIVSCPNPPNNDGNGHRRDADRDSQCAGAFHTVLTIRITDPAPLASDLERKRYRRVRCIRWLGHIFRL